MSVSPVIKQLLWPNGNDAVALGNNVTIRLCLSLISPASWLPRDSADPLPSTYQYRIRLLLPSPLPFGFSIMRLMSISCYLFMATNQIQLNAYCEVWLPGVSELVTANLRRFTYSMHHSALSRAAQVSITQPHTPLTSLLLLLLMTMMMRKMLVMRMQSRSPHARLLTAC